jgi:hypothetical protein
MGTDYGVQVLEGDILSFELRGPMTLDGLRSAGAAIAKTCVERAVPRALADARRQTGDLSILEWHGLAAGFEGSWPPGVRLAVLDHAERLKPDRIMETTARNRGIDVRVFTEEREALAWLRAWMPETT